MFQWNYSMNNKNNRRRGSQLLQVLEYLFVQVSSISCRVVGSVQARPGKTLTQ